MKKIILLFVMLNAMQHLTAQNVGIGTLTPQKRLHISGTNELLRIQGNQPWIGFMNNSDLDYKGFIYYPDTSLVLGSANNSNLPLIIAPNNIGLLHATSSQRIGIGVPNPTEKLDVNGNVNVQGNVKLNGVSGTDGQVLMTNNTGATVWSDLCDFKNIASYTQNGTWTIPAGVTKIMIEAWGGGGGGAAGGGGGGGAYIRTQGTTVSSPGSITINIGTGGAGAATEAATAGDGTQTTVTGAFGTYTAANGSGAGSNFGGATVSFALTGISLIQFPGQSGSPTTETYAERTSMEFATIRKYGDGGKTVSFSSSEGKGATFIFNTNTLANILLIRPISGKIGGGGGGGPTGFGVWGASGGPGMVIIHY